MPEILHRIQTESAVVVIAAPGAGKTTRMPPAICKSRILSPQHSGVVVLQPRRIAARTVAARIASENGWRLGTTVGYQVRMENCTGPETQITIMTEGILSRRLQTDPTLDGIGAVILDEFHMRTIHVDQALAMLLDVRENLRPDLKLIIASATIDAKPICDFLSASSIEVPGRTYSVAIQYSPLANRTLEKACQQTLEYGLKNAPVGHTLIFLPGVFEIHKLQRYLAPFATQHGMRICPLHGGLPLANQTEAIAPSRDKKIILATNAAETSVTVDGVTLVIDSGQVRSVQYDSQRGVNRLATHRISQASAHQRAGRAGRTAPGMCIRLWDSAEWKHQLAVDPPEITLVDLASLCLDVYRWNPRGFEALQWLTPPPTSRVESAKTLLQNLGAAECASTGFQLSKMGCRLAELPLHPRLSRIIAAGVDAGHAAWAIMVAAVLSDGTKPLAGRSAAPAWNLYTYLENISASSLGHQRTSGDSALPDGSIQLVFRQLCRACHQSTVLPPLPPEDVIAGLMLTGFPDRVCIMDEGATAKGVMVGGVGVQLAAGQVDFSTHVLIALDIQKNDDREKLASIHLAARLSMATLLNSKLPMLAVHKVLAWNDQNRRIVAQVETRLADLRIKAHRDTDPDMATARVLARRHLLPLCTAMLVGNCKVATLAERCKLLCQNGGGDGVLPLSADTLVDLLADYMCANELRPIPSEEQMVDLMLAALPYNLRRDLDTLVPAAITLASGKTAAVLYTPDGPILEARLADLLGTHESPRIVNGRVTVTCRILGPNFRPVQVTADLARFWRGSYHQVRKDLRARYPRHPWPENPLAYTPSIRHPKR